MIEIVNLISNPHLFLHLFQTAAALETISSDDVVERRTSSADQEDHCVWYDICNDDGFKKAYCPVNHTAKIYPKDQFDVIRENCAHLLEHEKDGKLNLCCTPPQVNSTKVLGESRCLKGPF